MKRSAALSRARSGSLDSAPATSSQSVVQARGDAVDGADEGAPAAADHAQAQSAPRGAAG